MQVYHYVVARDLGEEYTPEEIDRMIAEGLDDIEREDTVEGKEAFRQLRAHSAERRRQHVGQTVLPSAVSRGKRLRRIQTAKPSSPGAEAC